MATLVKGRGDIPIVLCCAEDDEAALAKVVDEMRREGMSPELVPGVEFDGTALTNAVDAAPPVALFVLCQSAALERAAVRRLTGLFSARGGPGQRVVTAAFTPSRPLAILPSIRVALKEMRLAGEPHEEPREPSSHLRDVVEALTDGNPRVAMASSSRPLRDDDAETLARELALGLAEAEAILERRADHADATPRPRRERRSSSDPVVASPAPVRAPETVRVPEPVLPSTVETVRGVSPVQTREVHGVTTDPEESARLPRRATPVIPDAPMMPPEPRGNRWLLVFAGLGVAGMVALALMQVISSGNDVPPVDDATRSRAAAVREPTPPAQPVPVADPRADVVRPSPAPPVPVERPTTPQVETPPVATPPVEDAPTNTEKVPPAPPKTMSKRDAETAALLLAAAEGKVARVGRLFVVRGGEESLTWDEAVAFCRSRKVAGVAGFRLPGRNELRRLKAAGLLGAATFWSRNKGAAGDDAFAIDGATGAENLYLLIEPSGRVACVHE